MSFSGTFGIDIDHDFVEDRVVLMKKEVSQLSQTSLEPLRVMFTSAMARLRHYDPTMGGRSNLCDGLSSLRAEGVAISTKLDCFVKSLRDYLAMTLGVRLPRHYVPRSDGFLSLRRSAMTAAILSTRSVRPLRAFFLSLRAPATQSYIPLNNMSFVYVH